MSWQKVRQICDRNPFFLWLIGSSLNDISERYFCIKELTTSDASLSHWKIPNCFPIFFLITMIMWQSPLLEPWSSLWQGKSGTKVALSNQPLLCFTFLDECPQGVFLSFRNFGRIWSSKKNNLKIRFHVLWPWSLITAMILLLYSLLIDQQVLVYA